MTEDHRALDHWPSGHRLSIPAVWLAALSLHPMADTHRRALAAIARLKWSGRHDDEEVVCRPVDLARIACLNDRAASLALTVLSHPAGEEYWNGSGRWRGVGALQRRMMTPSLPVFRLLHWSRWWWPADVQDQMFALAEVVSQEDPKRDRRHRLAVLAAEGLWRIGYNETGAPPVLRQPLDPRWLAWVNTMAQLLERGYSVAQLRAALHAIEQDDHYRKRMAAPDAHRLFEQYMPAFLARRRSRARV